MPQKFVYKGVPYTIGDEFAGRRGWFIGPEIRQPPDGHQGTVSADAGSSATAGGTFRRAVEEAWQAIDKLLDSR